MIEGRPNSPAVVAGLRTSQQQQARRARRLPPPQQHQGAAVRARRPVSDVRERRAMNQYSAPAARVLNTDAGAPPARGGMRQATRAAGADSGMRVCRIGPGADKDGTRCTGGRRGEARNIRE